LLNFHGKIKNPIEWKYKFAAWQIVALKANNYSVETDRTNWIEKLANE